MVIAKRAGLGGAAARAWDQVPVVDEQGLARTARPRVGEDDRRAGELVEPHVEPSVAVSATGGIARAREVVGGAVVDGARKVVGERVGIDHRARS